MCAGCMACINMCKKSAITIVDDYKTYNAVIDEVKCVNCGLCEKICPNVKCVEQVNPIFWKEGWALNPEIRSNASSGGIASSIIYSFIKNGGYVASCMLNKGEFVFELTNSTQRAEQFVGSKYVKSNPKTIYIDIERKLQEGKKVLFVGLPCQVAALKNFSRNQDNLYTVDLICHGSPSPELLKMYLKEKSVDIEELEGLNFREKTSFGLRSVGKNNGFPRIVDMYTYAFLKSIDYTENCYSCRYASQSRVSDISLGDSWGSELSDEVVLLRTAAVDDLLLFGVAKRGDGDDQPRHRGARVAAHEVDLLLLAGEGDAFVEVLKSFDGQFRRDAERHGDLRREGVHGQDVAHAGRHGLVTQVFERKIGEVEVDAFVEGVGRAEHRFAASRGDHRGVVPRALERRGVLRGESAGQQVDESELSERSDLGALFLVHESKIFYKIKEILLFPQKIT